MQLSHTYTEEPEGTVEVILQALLFALRGRGTRCLRVRKGFRVFWFRRRLRGSTKTAEALSALRQSSKAEETPGYIAPSLFFRRRGT